jgi:predicted amidohydrolase
MRLRNGESLPALTILPSRWSEQHNRATIVGWDGEVLACQDKHIPFVDQKNNKIEALMDLNERVTVLIHIPSVHRIAIVICAEFLSDSKSMREVICGNLGATLIIVPSYSRGEQDFINTLSALKGYGTTVIWGNCCGAVRGEQKAIGGCGIAGTTKTEIFSSVCKCGYSCENISACIFMVEIPLDFELQKTNKFDKAECVTHKIKQIDQTK